MATAQLHETHPEILGRLKRAAGHLNTVIAMLEGSRPCLEIAQQLHAVENAVANAKRTLIHNHVDHCLAATIHEDGAGGRQLLRQFKEITKYL